MKTKNEDLDAVKEFMTELAEFIYCFDVDFSVDGGEVNIVSGDLTIPFAKLLVEWRLEKGKIDIYGILRSAVAYFYKTEGDNARDALISVLLSNTDSLEKEGNVEFARYLIDRFLEDEKKRANETE